VLAIAEDGKPVEQKQLIQDSRDETPKPKTDAFGNPIRSWRYFDGRDKARCSYCARQSGDHSVHGNWKLIDAKKRIWQCPLCNRRKHDALMDIVKDVPAAAPVKSEAESEADKFFGPKGQEKKDVADKPADKTTEKKQTRWTPAFWASVNDTCKLGIIPDASKFVHKVMNVEHMDDLPASVNTADVIAKLKPAVDADLKEQLRKKYAEIEHIMTAADFFEAVGFKDLDTARENGITAKEIAKLVDEHVVKLSKPAPEQKPTAPTVTVPQVEPFDNDPPMAEFVEDKVTEPAQVNPPVYTGPKEIAIIDPNRALRSVRGGSDLIRAMMSDKLLIESGKDENGNELDGDYGKIAGSKKPGLFKSGAEKLCAAFGLVPEFESLPTSISNWDTPFFYFHYKCKLYRIGTGELVATANGSCNSKEDKYGWRWVEQEKIPPKYRQQLTELETRGGRIGEFGFAIEKAETSGKYGKSESYWAQFKNAMEKGTAIKSVRSTARGDSPYFEIDATMYRVPNPDVFSIVNTIDKMAQKRALVAAVLIGTAASLFFTQDLEDLPNFGMVA
jgi:hypothetical protein